MTTLGDARVTECEITQPLFNGVAYIAAKFHVDVITDGPIVLASVMDAIAAKVPAEATARVYAWPIEAPTPPCAIVAYPEDPIEFDQTFGRGSDMATFPLYFIAGKVSDRTARDVLSAIVTGAAGIKDAIDGALSSD